MRRRVIRMGIAAVLLLLVLLYGCRVYEVNTSPVVEYARPTTLEYEAGDAVALVYGYYNVGWLDLDGYCITVTGARIVSMEDLLAENGLDADSFYDMSYTDRNYVDPQYQYVYMVDAKFWFDGEGDPLEAAIDLTSFLLVGDDYTCPFGWELGARLDTICPILEGNSSFSIGSGKTIELSLPFLVDTESDTGLSLKYLEAHPPRLLVSQYPCEVYVSLPQGE